MKIKTLEIVRQIRNNISNEIINMSNDEILKYFIQKNIKEDKVIKKSSTVQR